ncbi:hypothetical protein K438DRAFT_1774533 [Mycena galopus ATCC 62051]|nr:hypothetical protein K438DRAFT_1774533 [Mycena galopus ATCC 62051]
MLEAQFNALLMVEVAFGSTFEFRPLPFRPPTESSHRNAESQEQLLVSKMSDMLNDVRETQKFGRNRSPDAITCQKLRRTRPRRHAHSTPARDFVRPSRSNILSCAAAWSREQTEPRQAMMALGGLLGKQKPRLPFRSFHFRRMSSDPIRTDSSNLPNILQYEITVNGLHRFILTKRLTLRKSLDLQSNRPVSVQVSSVFHSNSESLVSLEGHAQTESTGLLNGAKDALQSNRGTSDCAQESAGAMNLLVSPRKNKYPAENSVQEYTDAEDPQNNHDRAADPGAAERSAELTSANFELRPHPCTFPLPESVAVRGISAVVRTFLVDILPPDYPFLPFRPSSSPTSKKWHIPFFCFSGPDPPPTDIGSLGDIYVAPAASAMYGYLPVDGAADRGVWTRWSAVNCEKVRELKLGEPGVFGHPYFPMQLLWARGPFGWYSLSSVNNVRRNTRSLVENKDVESATKILVAHALQLWEEQANAGPKTRRKRQKADEPRVEQPRKKARPTLSASPDPSEDPQDTTDEITLPDWDAFYAKPRNNTRGTKELREQAATIASLEAENATLKMSHGKQSTAMGRLEGKLAALQAEVDEVLKTQRQKPRAAPERMPFPPEFLGFMRETFACEMMRICNAQRVAAETAAADATELIPFPARVQVAALEAKVMDLTDAMDIDADSPVAQQPRTNAQLEAARAYGMRFLCTVVVMTLTRSWQGGLDYTLQAATAQGNPALCMPETTTRGLEDRIQELEAENANVMAAAARDALSLRGAQACISDQQSKITALEADVARLTRITDEDTDALRRLLAGNLEGIGFSLRKERACFHALRLEKFLAVHLEIVRFLFSERPPSAH